MGTLVGASNQFKRFPLFCADGSIATGGTPQLVLPEIPARSLLKIQNTSIGPLWFEFGPARATAAITSGAVTGFTILNAGFNFTLPPKIILFGGGYGGFSNFVGLGQPGGPAPGASSSSGAGYPAKAHAVMTGTAPNLSLSSIAIDDPGAGYVTAPYVFIENSHLDPNGCAVPSVGVGMLLSAGSPPIKYDGTSCFTDAVSVYGATTGQTFICRWMQ